ncbi:kinase-like domain-containing protein [Flammula alnicola]|nr:kinase-like domain-containing protein [Flammula alnicola]
MPAIRSLRPSSLRDSYTPLGSKYVYRTVLGSQLGKPFKADYEGKYHQEFTESPDPNVVPIPKDPRPPTLSLKDMECRRVLGKGNDQVFMVAVKRKSHYMDQPSVFALKAMRRKQYRTHAATQLSCSSDRDAPLERHSYAVNSERASLAYMPWSPFVTGMLQSFHDSQMLYIALEFIPGGTLRSLIRKSKGGLSLADANFYYANLVLALEFLEKCKIAHRDVKPENILIGPDGYLVLTDFGSSAMADDSDGIWKQRGSPFYMAPECHLSSAYQPWDSPFSLDWWSSGCILYEMVTGKLAFCGQTSIATEMQILQGVFEWPLDVKIGRNLKDLVESLLTVEPASRLGSASAEEVQDHPWLSNVDWLKMSNRQYLAPFIPKARNMSELWHDMPLPKQSHVPGLALVEPPIHLAHDNRFPERPLI